MVLGILILVVLSGGGILRGKWFKEIFRGNEI